MSEIVAIGGREILDSRGNPTLAVDVELSSGARGRAEIPAGLSTGSFEAKEMRDRDLKRYRGLGVRKACGLIVDEIAPALYGMDSLDQRAIDRRLIKLDGTSDKHRLGGNTMLGVSLAVARAGAGETALPLYRYLGGIYAQRMPMPIFNLINGGLHADSQIAFQEIMLRPIGIPTFADQLRAASEILFCLIATLREKKIAFSRGDEGGVAPRLPSAEKAIELLLDAAGQCGFHAGSDVTVAIDCAAGSFFQGNVYDYSRFQKRGRKFNREQQIAYLEKLVRNFPIDSLEDPLEETDFTGFAELTERIGKHCQVVGDDLFVTNAERIRRGISFGSANAVLIKPNQSGTLTETLAAIAFAHANGLKTIVSHRSGDTADDFIADLAVAVNASQFKCGAPRGAERTVKYNRLLEIEKNAGIIAENA